MGSGFWSTDRWNWDSSGGFFGPIKGTRTASGGKEALKLKDDTVLC